MNNELRTAFFEDVASILDRVEDTVNETLSGSGYVPPSTAWAYERLSAALRSPEDVKALVAVIDDFLGVALHSVMVTIDGGSKSAEIGRVYLVDEAGESLGDGLHEWYMDHLYDTGRRP